MCEAQERTISVEISLEGNDAKGKRVRRTVVIGNVDQYPTQDLALAAVNGFTVSINEACNRQRQRSVLIGDLVDHYIQTELCVSLSPARRCSGMRAAVSAPACLLRAALLDSSAHRD